VSAPTKAVPNILGSERKASGHVGVVRKGGELLSTCGCRGHLYEPEARDCMRSMARAIGIKLT